MKTVTLSGKRGAGRVALVDDEDWPLVAPYRWCVLEFKRSGRIAGPYAITYNVDRTAKLMHSLITGWPLVDHRDHNGLNNRRSNLRPADASQNQANKRGTLNSSSIYKGVHWHSARRKWRAEICFRGVRRHLGSFEREDEAALAYNAAATETFGAYAYLNEVKSTEPA